MFRSVGALAFLAISVLAAFNIPRPPDQPQSTKKDCGCGQIVWGSLGWDRWGFSDRIRNEREKLDTFPIYDSKPLAPCELAVNPRYQQKIKEARGILEKLDQLSPKADALRALLLATCEEVCKLHEPDPRSKELHDKQRSLSEQGNQLTKQFLQIWNQELLSKEAEARRVIAEENLKFINSGRVSQPVSKEDKNKPKDDPCAELTKEPPVKKVPGAELPFGVSITPTKQSKDGLPTVSQGAPFQLTIKGQCSDARVYVEIQDQITTGSETTVDLKELPRNSGSYSANIPRLYGNKPGEIVNPRVPFHGPAEVRIWIKCPGPANRGEQVIHFPIFID